MVYEFESTIRRGVSILLSYSNESEPVSDPLKVLRYRQSVKDHQYLIHNFSTFVVDSGAGRNQLSLEIGKTSTDEELMGDS